jgi:hypothetical protein
MISIVCSSQNDLNEFSKHIKKMAGHPKVEFLGYKNEGKFSLTEIYNRGLNEAKYDIVVFLHHDIEIQTKQFAKKLQKNYDTTNYGVLGVAGTKLLPETGKWWSDPKQMFGRVWHTHQDKKFLSKYSDDQGNNIEEVVSVDGVFFSVMKSRLKENFDESVEGFHFYDIDFCFKNYLKGVKVGVHTNIVISHMSIGETNDQWEINRVLFSEKYKDDLPVKIDKEFGVNHKFNVLIACINFNSYTGSELYNFELAKGLIEKGCDVTICSNIGGELSLKAKRLGIKLADINEPPGYKKGDGQWQIQQPDGKLEQSVEGRMYQIGAVNFDIMHLSHTPVAKLMTQLYPQIPAISSIHSEVISLEHPILHDNIKKYIAIRPEIKDYLISEHNIPEEKIKVVYNPIDSSRFNTNYTKVVNGKKVTLFVGTIDYLRKNMLVDLVGKTKEENGELWIVGRENGVTASEIINDEKHVIYYGPQANIESYMKKADVTAGILLGRTTIEGWMCGKGGWIYNVDDKGFVLGKEFHKVPEDINKFNSESIITEIIDEYKEILK